MSRKYKAGAKKLCILDAIPMEFLCLHFDFFQSRSLLCLVIKTDPQIAISENALVEQNTHLVLGGKN